MTIPGLFIDGFAGGGGASTGIAQAIGRDPDIAVNHSSAAIAIHRANHPGTDHHCCDIRLPFLPRTATRGRRVWGVWFSPDCKEYSKAKGGPVKDRSIRALCWEVIEWVRETQPEVGFLENVEEFQYAAPLDGEGVPIADQKGREFKRFVRALRGLGFRVQWRILKACDYGAPTSRKRLYMIYRRDGLPIVWPKPTHAPANDNRVLRGELLPYRTAAECIDWTIPCPSIFERDRELAEATKRRIAHGVMRYVVNAAHPFIVGRAFTNTRASRVFDPQDPLRTVTTQPEYGAVDCELAPHITKFRGGAVGSDMTEPMPTVTANGQPVRPAGAMPLGLVGATMVKMGNGEREGQAPRALDVAKPYGTVTAKGSQAAAVTAFLSSFYGSDKTNGSGDPERPLRSARAGGQHHAVVAAHIEQANTGMVGHTPRKPLSTIVGKGCTQRIVETTMIERDALPAELMERAVRVAAFLIKYYGNESDGHGLDQPIGTVTTKDRFAVVTVTIDAKTYVIVDIGLRMLKPRELARAQGFPDDYVLDPVVRKLVRGKWVEKPLTIAEQISAIGNSVCPPVARALVAANQPGIADERLAA
ncbi:DNA cytosine methyltransferase [Sphingopyxis indica]|uniref:DNA cytosine methyltransferase n=1 Tax=Sphingopyxis indica TaxID=436663 RepID=UPI0029394C22|nr:DNA cytosine methyltransferase [Sphingopyxis indica]WOF43786.1 DNA cytosine methyltransferase [Sphingopyxis indica]